MNQTKHSDFKAKRVTRNYRQTIKAEPAAVHALICPVKEAEWLDGWDYRLIFSLSGLAEEGCVFVSKNQGAPDTIWLITQRDDTALVTEFVRVNPEEKIAQLKIQVKDAGQKLSHVHISYTFTALTEAGNTFIDNFTEENFEKDMQFWEATMNHYLETGKPLPNPNRDDWLRYNKS